MAYKSYYEKLKDPRWQKKRLEIMNDRDFTCEVCFDKSTSLNVHHKEYFKGKEPWEYDDNQLSCLCENCHHSIHKNIDSLKWVCSQATLTGPDNREELSVFIAGFLNIDYEVFIENTNIENTDSNKILYSSGKTSNESLWKKLMKHYSKKARSIK